MAGPFNVEAGVPGTQVWSVDASGNQVQSGNLSLTSTSTLTAGTLITAGGTLTTTGVTVQNNGINSSGSVNYLTTIGFGVSGATGTQLTDKTRDYMVYVTTTAGGANATFLIGATSACTSTIFACATVGTGALISYRLPAGWFSMWTPNIAIGQQNAVSC